MTKLKTIHGLKTFMIEEGTQAYNDGFAWYKEAHAFACELSDMTGQPLEVVTAVIAVLSPAVSWETNKKDAIAMLTSANPESVTVSTYGQNKTKAVNLILHGDLSQLGGRKVTSFYHNILNPDCTENITIDRHAARACHGLKGLKMSSDDIPPIASDKRYNAYKVLYQRLAKNLGLVPCQLQAIIWVNFRTELGL